MSDLKLCSGEFYILNNFKEKIFLINKGEADLFIGRIDENNNLLERKYLITVSSDNSKKIIDSLVINEPSDSSLQFNYSYVLVPCGEVEITLIDDLDMLLSANDFSHFFEYKTTTNLTELFYKKITSSLKHNYLYRELFIWQYEKVSSISDIINICFNNSEQNLDSNNDDQKDSKINIDLAIQEKINALRGLIGSDPIIESSQFADVSDDENFKLKYSQSVMLAIKQLTKYYNLSIKEENFSNIFDISSFINRLSSEDIRLSKCSLTSDFYKTSFKPILAFKKDETPIVVYSKFGKAYYIDVSTNKKIYITDKNVKEIESFAYNFYFIFPEQHLSFGTLVKFIFSNSFNVLFIFAILGIVGSLFGIIMPMFTSYTIDHLIPFGKFDVLLEISIFLLVISISQTLLNIIPSITIMIFSVNQMEKYMGALFDRLLKLSPSFLKNYTNGDLTSRLFGGIAVQNAIFQIITGQFISLLAIITGLAMMFYYDPLLGAIGIVITLVFSIIFLVLSLLNYVPLKKQAEISGNLSGLTKQIFSAIIKIREAGAESRILNHFLKLFVKKEKIDYLISKNSSLVKIFSNTYPLLVSVIFYTLIIHFHDTKNFSLGIFMAFMSAFQYFSSGVSNLFQSIWSILAIQPSLNRIKPLLDAKIECDSDMVKIEKLQGQVELSNVSFKYNNNDSYILDDISIKVSAGDFIAIVGPSGSGKSSLLKILLGFESPSKGSVYYDGNDLKVLDLQSLRSKMGVVLQQNKLINASILDNILIGTNKSYEDAKEAIVKASLEQDIEDFSMGIHTIVTDDTLSGGQKQRVLIARSLVRNPNIVILDEATSALDNITQQNVMNTLKDLSVTRIVVAHRISTIKDADCIYVLDKGKIVEKGTYNELLEKNGLFMRMVKRQSI